MNIDNINKTIEFMRLNREYHFNMGSYVDYVYDDTEDFEEANICGTSCCLAGFAYVAKTGNKAVPNHASPERVSYRDIATEYFGIDDNTASRLFVPDTEGIMVEDISVGIRALEYFRDTGKILWETPEFDTEGQYQDRED